MNPEELHRLHFWIQRGELYRESRGNDLLTSLHGRLVRYTYTRGADRQQRGQGVRDPDRLEELNPDDTHPPPQLDVLYMFGDWIEVINFTEPKKRDFMKNIFKQSVNTRCNRTKSEQREQPEPVKRPGSGRGAEHRSAEFSAVRISDSSGGDPCRQSDRRSDPERRQRQQQGS